MFLKSSLSNTRKFFTRTLQNLKSFFNEATYQRLPKSSPMMPFSCIGRHGLGKTLSQSYRELDKFYTDFTNEELIGNRRDSKQKRSSTSIKGSGHASVACSEDYDRVEKCIKDEQKKMIIVGQGIGEERRSLVARKLKELEGMDLSNVENAMDIQEVLHYYSHLTSPVYMEIFDQFFIYIYADLFKHFSRHHLNLKPAT